MQLKIAHKLVLIAIIPIVTLLIFSINHIDNKYTQIEINSKQLINANFIKHFSASLHVLQIERGLSTSYLSKKQLKNNYEKLQEQYKNSDIVFKQRLLFLKTVEKDKISNLQSVLIDGIHASLSTLKTIRERLLKKDIKADEIYNFYTNVDNQILDLATSLNLHMEDENTQNKVLALYKLIQLQEKAGQERAHVCTFDTSKPIPTYKLQRFYSLAIAQGDLQTSIFNFFYKTINSKIFLNILNDHEYSYIEEVRENISKQGFDINLDRWFNDTSKKIEALYHLSMKLNEDIIKHEKDKYTQLYNSLLLQVALTLITILLLILGTYKNIKYINNSIYKLGIGVQDFFKYLEFKKGDPSKVELYNYDEIGVIAHSINSEIDLLKNYKEQDQAFIYEVTKIVRLMKDGSFNHKVISEPNSPHLKELKLVLSELIKLIRKKIDEQTKNLEALNFSLEDKVIRQTHELKEKVKEMTIARDKAVIAEKSKDEFLANMSHEIRTPLNAILGFVTILKKQTDDEKFLNYLNIIDNSSKSLLTVINDILDFSKIQSGHFSINPHIVSPASECENVMMLFASKAYEKHITYAIYIDKNIPYEIKIDGVRVKQIISNLLSNAIKFTPENGEVKVRVSVENSLMKVSVQDSGIGVSKENQKKIFTAFEQADGSTTRKYGGTGLGLSISSKLASLMAGELSLVSKENDGTTFNLSFPVEVVNDKNIHIIDTNLENKKIKLLQSSKNNLTYVKLLHKYLNDFGFKEVEIVTKYNDEYDLIFFFEDEKDIDLILSSPNKAIEISNELTTRYDSTTNISQLLIPFFASSIFNTINKALNDT